jgi:hypothetical protein
MIAKTSFTAGLDAFGGQLSGNELVHTAYFEQDEVVKLIAGNMAWGTEKHRMAMLQTMPPWLGKWFVAAKEGMIGQRSTTPKIGQVDDRPEPSIRQAG